MKKKKIKLHKINLVKNNAQKNDMYEKKKKTGSPVGQNRRNRNPVIVKYKGMRDTVAPKGLARLNIWTPCLFLFLLSLWGY